MTLFDPDPRGEPCVHGRYAEENCASCADGFLVEPTPLDTEHAWLRNDATDEEADAALTVAKATGSRYRMMMLDAHDRHPGGLTDDAASAFVDHPDMPPPRAASRRGELVKWGWLTKKVAADGNPVKAKTRTGHQAQVWVLTPQARRLIAGGALL